ncbi:MAG: LamG domain-containing protein, partial [Chloroflexi bacterium]|nr:LamG domain-containing protein [Chloroflexota bacterium]
KSDPLGADNVWDTNYIGVWHFEEDPTNSDLIDSTNGQRNGIVSAVTNTPVGLMGAADLFSESNSYVQIQNNNQDFDFAGPFTLGIWVFPTNGSRNELFNKGNEALAGGFAFTIVSDNALFINGDENKLQSELPVQRSDWSYLVVSWDGVVLKMYANGAVVDTNTSVAGLNLNASSSLFISKSDNIWGFDGSLDEARVTKGI